MSYIVPRSSNTPRLFGWVPSSQLVDRAGSILRQRERNTLMPFSCVFGRDCNAYQDVRSLSNSHSVTKQWRPVRSSTLNLGMGKHCSKLQEARPLRHDNKGNGLPFPAKITWMRVGQRRQEINQGSPCRDGKPRSMFLSSPLGWGEHALEYRRHEILHGTIHCN